MIWARMLAYVTGIAKHNSVGASMNRSKLVFAQLMQHLPLTTFRRCVTRYRGTFKVKSFSCRSELRRS